MIRALVTGELRADPQQRTGKNGKPFALARISVQMGDEGRVLCSVIAFQDEAVARLLQLRAGASVAVAGTLKVGSYTGSDGTVRPNLDMVADEVAATTPRLKKSKPKPAPAHQGHQCGRSADDPFADLPGAGNLDWPGA